MLLTTADICTASRYSAAQRAWRCLLEILSDKFNACFRLSTPTTDFWRVNVSNIHWGNQSVLNEPALAIFDTGATGIILPTEQWESLHEVSHKHLTAATSVICCRSFHMLWCVSCYTCHGVWIARSDCKAAYNVL